MLKATLQLRLGQQLTMTPQLQQAIRLLQLPALELQALIREQLESNVMLESLDDLAEPAATGVYETKPATDTAVFDGPATATVQSPEPPAAEQAPQVDIADDAWSEQSTGPSETPWSGQFGDGDRSQEFSDQR